MHIIISPFDDGSICMKMRKSLSYPSFVHRTRHLNMTVWLCSQRANFYNAASTATICQKMANPTFLCKLRRFSKTFFRFLKVYLFSLCSVVTTFFFEKKTRQIWHLTRNQVQDNVANGNTAINCNFCPMRSKKKVETSLVS